MDFAHVVVALLSVLLVVLVVRRKTKKPPVDSGLFTVSQVEPTAMIGLAQQIEQDMYAPKFEPPKVEDIPTFNPCSEIRSGIVEECCIEHPVDVPLTKKAPKKKSKKSSKKKSKKKPNKRRK